MFGSVRSVRSFVKQANLNDWCSAKIACPSSSSSSSSSSAQTQLSSTQSFIDIPKNERPHAPLFPHIIHRTPPAPQHDHPAGQHDALVRPATRIELRVVVDFVRLIARGGRRRRRRRAVWGQGIEILHHGDALPARDLFLRRERVQDAAALKRFGVVARAAEGAEVEAALGRFGTRVGCRV